MLSFFPYAHARVSVFLACENTCSVLFSVEPLSCVNLPVWPLECALSLLYIVYKVTLVLATVRPDKLAISMHLVFDP